MPRNYIQYLLFCFLIIVLSCQSGNKSQSVVYSKPPEEKSDTIETYLKDGKKLADKNYAKTYTEKIEKHIKKGEIDSAARTLAIVGETYYVNYELNQEFINKQLQFLKTYEKQTSVRYLSNLYFHIGSQYYEKGSTDSAISFLNKGLVKPTDYYTTFYKGNCLYMLSILYMNNGQHEKSIEAGLKAQKDFEAVGDIARQADALDAVGGLFRVSNEYNESLKLNSKAYKLALLSKDTNSIIGTCLSRLSLYNEMKHPNFFAFIDSAVVFANQFNVSKENKILIYSYKVSQLSQQKKLKEAQQILSEYKDTYQRTTFLNAKEHYELALADYEAAKGLGSPNIKQYESLIPEIKKNKDFVRLCIYYQILKDDAAQKKNYERAYEYQSLLETASDSISNIKMRAKVKELDRKYQVEKKEQQITLQQQEITQKNTYIALLVASLSGLLLAVFAYYLWQRQKLLRQEKTNSMNFTKQLLENTEEERKRIASDLHDSISHELLNLKSIFTQDLSVVNKKIDTIINDIRGISRNLHPVMFDKIGLVPNVEQLVERIQNQNNFFISTDIVYTGLLTSADELQIYRIIQEALTNIIKYAKAHAAKITILEEKDKILIEIRDNGKGFDVKQALNSGKAFGLHNIIERSRVIGGEANISSSSDGSVITINIPRKS